MIRTSEIHGNQPAPCRSIAHHNIHPSHANWASTLWPRHHVPQSLLLHELNFVELCFFDLFWIQLLNRHHAHPSPYVHLGNILCLHLHLVVSNGHSPSFFYFLGQRQHHHWTHYIGMSAYGVFLLPLLHASFSVLPRPSSSPLFAFSPVLPLRSAACSGLPTAHELRRTSAFGIVRGTLPCAAANPHHRTNFRSQGHHEFTVRAKMLSKLIPGSPKIEFESWN